MYRLHRDKAYHPCTTRPKKKMLLTKQNPPGRSQLLVEVPYLTEALNRPYCHIDARFCCSCSACCDAALVWSIYDASLNHYGFVSHASIMHYWCNARPIGTRLYWCGFPASRLNFPVPIPSSFMHSHPFPAPARCRAHQENQKNS